MGGMGAGAPGWVAVAMPLLLVLGVMRALYAAAQRRDHGKGKGQPKSVGFAASVAVFVGTWMTALALWSGNYVLTLPGHDALGVSRYGLYLLADLALLGLLWAGLAYGIIRLARHRAKAAL